MRGTSLLPLLIWVLAVLLLKVGDANAQAFGIGEQDFLLDGKPFQIRSGEMHFARIPPEYWKHRLQMVRAMGCNTVCAYLFWNMHEPSPGQFDFSGPADVAEYCRQAQEVGLKVILRPGPYSCAEWEFGGLPWWLLKEPEIQVRTRDARYLEGVRRYLLEVGKQLSPLQITNGGPIIMVQVENEYGSYGNDKEYIGDLRDILVEAGFNVPLFTCDGPSQLPNDTRPEIFSVVNFGDNPKASFESLRKIRPAGPLMCGEYYPGWFDSWGKEHHTGSTENVLKDLQYMLENKASFSIYMVHGGTSFGFTAGANSPPYSPQTTSYDYDAPIDEAGNATPKYFAIRELFAKYLLPGETLPDVPKANPVIAIPRVTLKHHATLLDNLGVPWHSEKLLSMEMLDQATGFILYRKRLNPNTHGTLTISGAHDIGRIYLDGALVGSVDRRFRKSIAIPIDRGGVLDILVEAMGRVNYGKDIHDRKGLVGSVELSQDRPARPLTGWDIFSLPFDAPWMKRLKYSSADAAAPSFHRGEFSVTRPGDSYLDMRGWGKGTVWVNGHNLGRFWSIGPQQTLYLPGSWLRQGTNEVIVFDAEPSKQSSVQGLTAAIINQLGPDPFAPPLPVRRKGAFQPDSSDLILKGVIEPGGESQEFDVKPVRCRYIALQSLTSQRSDPFASVAELNVLTDGGEAMPQGTWKVFYVDSEELESEDGRAENAFDGDPETIWHTQWGKSQPLHPHVIIIDLGKSISVTGVRYLPRPTDSPGRIREFRLYARESEFTIGQ